MTRKAIILNGAKADFLEIRNYVRRQFGDLVWAEVNQEFKDTIKNIAANPLLGTHIEELGALGYEQYRKTLVRQSRVIYEIDSKQIIVHMFIHTKRDFKTHLEKRLIAPFQG
jgi:plasmid stabilization system protein ParE